MEYTRDFNYAADNNPCAVSIKKMCQITCLSSLVLVWHTIQDCGGWYQSIGYPLPIRGRGSFPFNILEAFCPGKLKVERVINILSCTLFENWCNFSYNEGQKCWHTSVKWPLFAYWICLSRSPVYPNSPQNQCWILDPQVFFFFYFRQHWYEGWGDLQHLKSMK